MKTAGQMPKIAPIASKTRDMVCGLNTSSVLQAFLLIRSTDRSCSTQIKPYTLAVLPTSMCKGCPLFVEVIGQTTVRLDIKLLKRSVLTMSAGRRFLGSCPAAGSKSSSTISPWFHIVFMKQLLRLRRRPNQLHQIVGCRYAQRTIRQLLLAVGGDT